MYREKIIEEVSKKLLKESKLFAYLETFFSESKDNKKGKVIPFRIPKSVKKKRIKSDN